MEAKSDLIYLIFGCGKNTEISLFNISKAKMIVLYKGSVSNSVITFMKNLVFLASDLDSQQAIIYLDRAHADSLNSIKDFRISTNSLTRISSESNYTIKDGQLRDYSNLKETVKSSKHDITENSEVKDLPPSKSVGEIEYFLSPVDLGSVVHNHMSHQILKLTRAKTHNFNVNYTIGKLEEEGSELPSWISISEDMNLTINPPYVSQEKVFNFYINSLVVQEGSQPRNFSKLVSFRVIQCKVDQ